MLRDVIKDVTIRAVTVELTAAMDTSAGWLSMPFEAVDSIRDFNPHLGNTEPALVATITNVGMVDSSIVEVTVYVRPGGEHAEAPRFTLLGRNDFPHLNPPLPKYLRVGESVAWMTRVSTIRGIVAAGAAVGIDFVMVWAQVRLATGETIRSQDVAVAALPRD